MAGDSRGAEAKRKPGRPKGTTGQKQGGDALILRSAMNVFAEKGFSGATVREVAGACGVDPALINHHFGSKLGLWQAVVDHHAHLVLTEITEASCAPGEFTAVERFRRIIMAFIKITASNRSVSFFLLRELVDQSDRDRYRYINKIMMNPIKMIIFPYIEKSIKDGEIPKFDPDYLFVSITSAVVSSYVALAEIEKGKSLCGISQNFIDKMSDTLDLMLFK